MFSKPRKPRVLRILEILRSRMHLPADQQLTLKNLHRGYVGERRFAALLEERFHSPCIQLYGLRFKIGNNELQIDCLLIFQNTIYLLEIKNYQGDYYTEKNKWFSVTSGEERKNPLNQLNRSDILLQEFLSKHHFQSTIASFIVFVHPGFHLYEAPLKSPIIYPTQLERFIKKLNTIPANLHSHHHKLADQLRSVHITESTHDQLPDYDYNELKKGVVCKECNHFLKRLGKNTLFCNHCGVKVKV